MRIMSGANENRCFLCSNVMEDVVEEIANGTFDASKVNSKDHSKQVLLYNSCPACLTPLSEMDRIIKDTNLNHNAGEMCLDDCSNCSDKECDMYKLVKQRKDVEGNGSK